MKRPLSWNSGAFAIARATASSETVMPEPLGLELDQAVGDEAVEDLLLETHLTQHGLVEPALVHALVDLALARVSALHLADGDGQPAHRDDGLAGCAGILPASGRPGCTG